MTRKVFCVVSVDIVTASLSSVGKCCSSATPGEDNYYSELTAPWQADSVIACQVHARVTETKGKNDTVMLK